MSEVSLPVGLVDTTIALTFGVITALIGIIYRSLKRRINEVESQLSALEKEQEELDKEHIEIHQKLDTVFAWAFGNEEDSTDRGLSGDIDEQFDELTAELREIQDQLDERHGEIRDKIEQLINALHDEESLEFERDDIE